MVRIGHPLCQDSALRPVFQTQEKRPARDRKFPSRRGSHQVHKMTRDATTDQEFGLHVTQRDRDFGPFTNVRVYVIRHLS